MEAEDTRAGRRFARSLPNAAKSYLEVRYEELVGAPEATLQRVCGFLGEAYRPEMLSFYRSKAVLFKNEPWKDTTFRPGHYRLYRDLAQFLEQGPRSV